MSAATADLPAVDRSEAISRLFAEHYRRVLHAAYRVTGELADAEDIAQSVFLRLGAGAVPEMSNAGSYLYRAAINGAIDLVRSRKRRSSEPLDAAEFCVTTGRGASPEAELGNRELVRCLRQALAELSPRAAEIFALRYLEEMDNREIATLVGASQAVVAVTLYQVRSKLRKRLAELQGRKR
ncbi:MAG: RNA polymerase sigma factor [Acidobacteriaceae bacterium]